MTDVEDRLADLFAAVESDVAATLPPRRPPVGRRVAPSGSGGRRRTRAVVVVAAAAVICAVVALATVASRGDRRDVVAGPDVTVAPATFDAAAGSLCRVLARERGATEPTFATVDGYLAAAEARRAVLAATGIRVERLGAPADRPGLLREVRVHLQAAAEALDRVGTAARDGDVPAAAAAWQDADLAVDRAIAPLAEHGAEPCRG